MSTLSDTSAPSLEQPILKVCHVCCGFSKGQGELKVLDDVNLALKDGEIVGLLGR